MKVLHVQKVKGIAGSENGFLTLLPELQNRGIQVGFLCFYEKRHKVQTKTFLGQLKAKGIQIFEKEIPHYFGSFISAKFISHIVNSNSFTLVHSHLIHADFWCAISRRFGWLKIPIISTKHGYEERFLAKNGFDASKVSSLNVYYQLAKFAETQIKESFSVSEGLASFYKDSGITKLRTKVIYHGVNLPDFSKNIKNAAFQLGSPQIIVVGRLVPFKGHKFVLDILEKVNLKFPDFSVLFLGDGNDQVRKELENKVEKLGLSKNVYFLGYQQNINDYLAASDLKIVPSIAEGFGLIFLEAMNHELPIIGFNVPATNEIIVHNETGVLVTPYVVEELSKSVIELLSDKDKMQKLGKAGRERLKTDFSVDKMANSILSIYKKNS